MKTETWKPMKYLAGLLAVMLLITSMPVSAHAAEAPTGTQEVTVQHDYDITQAGAYGSMIDDSDALNGQAYYVSSSELYNDEELSVLKLKNAEFCRVYHSKIASGSRGVVNAADLVNNGEYNLYPIWKNLTAHQSWQQKKDPMYILTTGNHGKADSLYDNMVYNRTGTGFVKHTLNVYLSMKLDGEYSAGTDAYTGYYFDKIVVEATHTLEEYEYTPATCGSDATITGTCTTCSQTVTGTPEGYTRPAHDYSESEYEASDDGYTATCSGCGATDTIDAPVFHQTTVSLEEGNINLNYYTKLPSNLTGESVTFTVNGNETTSTGTKEPRNGIPYYKFTYPLSAKQMTDTINATIGGENAPEYSVKEYADYILSGADYKQTAKDLVTAMLHYGAYAQLHFGYNTDNLANKDLDPADLDSVTADKLSEYACSSEDTAKAKFVGCSLILESETTLRFFFKVSEDATLTVNSDDGALEVKTRGDYQYVDIKNISAKDLDTVKKLTVSDGENIATVEASALSYCYSVLNNASDFNSDLVDLVKALYLYNAAANAY